MTQEEKIIIYTDGSCLGNPGKGGWGALMFYKGHKKQISGSHPQTTNNRMEITAVIEALKTITKTITIEIYTDSKYVKDGINSWIYNWKKNNWKNSKKQAVKNADLWQELDNLVQKYKISWHWVKAHNGNEYNEIVDTIARNAAEKT